MSEIMTGFCADVWMRGLCTDGGHRSVLPKVEGLLASVKDAKVFSSLDAASGHHCIPWISYDQAKSAITTPFDHDRVRVLSLVLTDAPAVGQALVSKSWTKQNREVRKLLNALNIPIPTSLSREWIKWCGELGPDLQNQWEFDLGLKHHEDL